MTDRAERVISSLLAELSRIHAELVTVAQQVPFVREASPRSEIGATFVTRLDPTLEQVNIATVLTAAFRRWTEVVNPFLERQDQAVLEAGHGLAELFETYLQFSRVGGDISEQLWKELFARESHAIVAALARLLKVSESGFDVLRSRESRTFNNFTLRLRKEADAVYRVEASCLQGEAESIIQFPYDRGQVHEFVARHCQPRGRLVRRWIPGVVDPFAGFGQSLYEALFSGRVRDLYLVARHASVQHGIGLRLRLRLQSAPALLAVPWETLFDGHEFLALNSGLSIVRHFDSSAPVPVVGTPLRMRLLVTTSSARGLPDLDVETEHRQLRSALARLTALGLIRVDFAPDGTLRTLQRMLRSAAAEGRPYKMWHHIGHGGFNEQEGMSALVFEGRDGHVQPVSGFELGALLSNHPSIRLILLNACEAARPGDDDHLSGVAGALLASGLPAVIAMQFEISDEAAIALSEEFYAALIDGLPVDAALAEARRAVFFMPNYSEWATPVLFMRTDGDVMFDVDHSTDLFDESHTLKK